MTKNLNGYKAAVLTVSDRSYAGVREDLGGPLLRELLEDLGFEVVAKGLVPDEVDRIKDALIEIEVVALA